MGLYVVFDISIRILSLTQMITIYKFNPKKMMLTTIYGPRFQPD